MAAAVTRTRPAARVAAGGVAVAAALVVSLASCGRAGDDPPDGSPTPPPAPSPSGVDEVGSPADAEFPSSPQEYAETAVAAWAAPDLLRLAELAPSPVHEQIAELPGPPNLTWTFIRCEESDDTSACAFHNADGDYLVLTVDHELLAAPYAVTEADFDATAFPADPRDYVQAFVAAWQVGNLARMNQLALPDAVEVFQRLTPGPATGYTVGEVNDRRTAVAFILAEAEIETKVSTGLLGEPQAIREATSLPIA